ncbi:MAG: bacillithiol biosynthesis cysteine-adding enzyme BshC [Bacteroidota bacterium]
MHLEKFELEQTGGFSPLFLDYISQKPSIQPFYSQFPDLEGFANSLKSRKFEPDKRQNLVTAMQKQYAGISNSPDFSMLLNDRCFTVTTGHQLNIFTGPLYVIYKIVSTINLAKNLKKQFPDYQFVPVYWMATEDHDFAEINHFNLFNKTYTWQTDQKGAVGQMQCAEIDVILSEIPEKIALFEEAYRNATSLTHAVRTYMHELFGEKGLICVDGDDVILKSEFKSIIQSELTERKTAELVENDSENLEKLGYKTQVKGREINLFYLEKGLRERIVFENGSYHVLNSDLNFSEKEILDLVESNPEKFSPNVILRPVYQEVILPNIAYLGGPAEVVYWLQLKGAFDQFDVQFPIVMPRNFALYINGATKKRMDKLGMATADLWHDEHDLKRNYIAKNSENQFEITNEITQIGEKFDKILAKALPIDKTLEGVVLAEKQKAINAIESLEKRIKKAEERTFETAINQLIGVKNKLFPNGSPQERSDNFLNFYLNNPEFINQLIESFDPLDFRFNVLVEE